MGRSADDDDILPAMFCFAEETNIVIRHRHYMALSVQLQDPDAKHELKVLANSRWVLCNLFFFTAPWTALLRCLGLHKTTHHVGEGGAHANCYRALVLVDLSRATRQNSGYYTIILLQRV